MMSFTQPEMRNLHIAYRRERRPDCWFVWCVELQDVWARGSGLATTYAFVTYLVTLAVHRSRNFATRPAGWEQRSHQPKHGDIVRYLRTGDAMPGRIIRLPGDLRAPAPLPKRLIIP